MFRDLDSSYIAARRLSDMTFAKTEVSINSNKLDHKAIWRGFDDAAAAILRNIPEAERSPEDHLRIMSSYQHAIQHLTRHCGWLLTDLLIHYSSTSHSNTMERVELVKNITSLLDYLNALVTMAENYLQHIQRNMFQVDLNFFLAAMTGLSEYHERAANWRIRQQLPSEFRQMLTQTKLDPVQFAETMFKDIYKYIEPKISMLDATQLRDLTNCHHAITNIYRDAGSVQKCVEFAMIALQANNSILPAFKTKDDIGKFYTILVSILNTAGMRNAEIEAIANIGHYFFGGLQRENNVEKLDSTFKNCMANGTLFELQFLLQIMRIIADNYQRQPYPTNLQDVLLNDLSYKSRFASMMTDLQNRIAAKKYGNGERFFANIDELNANQTLPQPAFMQRYE